ncbi:DUF2357 domain-containing protein [Nocardioides sp. JQ2195]|uniref:DUF2357 domain-containing protein n=1 Tax=Nocardioides sp. JQ2195 TaxID=2592334 RepID=UPI00143E5E6B|nr:DUF2357 domain-containing protein [Nocardioides sp. JQ2195]QIX26938.1 DUF2357 domain-containing protein [Nocardioides sp. JQ2195]
MSLRIQTDRWDITVEGVNKASVWEGRAGAQQPRLRVTTEGRDRVLEVTADGTTSHPEARTYDGVGARLVEETNYRLSIVNKVGNQPTMAHLDPALVRDVRPIPGYADVLSGNINFRSQVGDSRFLISDDESSIEVIVEVRPSKLDYETDYEELLDSVTGLARQLVLEFLRATTRGASTGSDPATRQIEWLLLLREEVQGLKQALAYIAANPHQQLVRETQLVAAERIRRPSAATLRAVVRGSGEGSWQVSPGIGRHRSRLPASQPYETLDSPENRWLRVQLERATNSLAQLREAHEASQSNRKGKPSARNVAIANELAAMEESLVPFLSTSPLTDAAPIVAQGFTSLTLQGRPGYREAYQALLRLNMSLIVGGDAVNIPMRDLSELYEIWCFLAVVHQVSEVLDTPIDVFDLIELRDTGVRLNLVPGAKSTVKIQAATCAANVTYNREYQMRSGPQRPDIVIELLRDDMPPVLLLLDAKYRVDSTPEYVRTFGCPGPPADAIGQLHRYRDAITVKYPRYRRGRPVVRAAALFPLGEGDSQAWVEHPYFGAIDEVGIGALPFLPSNTAWVEEWLRHGIDAPADRLAWPGPDFIAWSQVRKPSHL